MRSPRRTQTSFDTAETVPKHERVREIDVLRGFALLGILLVNVTAMAGPRMGSGGELGVSRVDEMADWLLTTLVSAKFFPLFSFLFGYSFTLQKASADRTGTPFVPRYLRRLTGLFLLGLAHGVLLFPGDVLMVYAVLGLVLFAVRDIEPRTAVRAAACLVTGVALCLLVWGMATVAYTEPVNPQDRAAAIQETAAAYRGGFGSVVQANLGWLHYSLGWNVLYGADMLAALLAGLAAGRRGLLVETHRYRAWMVRIAVCALPVGLAGSTFMAVCRNGPLDARWYDVGSAVGVLTAPALTASYVCGLLLLLRTRPGGRIAGALAGAGRLALTHYLTQSLVMAFVFTGYGLAWYGRHGTAVLLAGCFALYAAQLAVGGWLLRRARYGPAEWLLRAATLGRRP
ncbi:DUF418 domain-containing protein [Streptomyces sp. NBC_01723]|uniref:DUF418 domain-containing protein n=1 Tax=Streptomyces sp. NBC_01723 TaxID=2975921 RepID=UPI002E2EAA8D|nr:DUF418 domain-containing protein [Streptomyces sp. NBC_01723]